MAVNGQTMNSSFVMTKNRLVLSFTGPVTINVDQAMDIRIQPSLKRRWYVIPLPAFPFLSHSASVYSIQRRCDSLAIGSGLNFNTARCACTHA